RARQPGAAIARARDRAVRGRPGLASAGLGPRLRPPLHARRAGRAHPPARRRAADVTRATIEPLGEDALLLRLGRCIDADVNARVHALARRLLAEAPAWLEEVVPAFASLAVRLREEATGDADRLHEAREWLSRLLDDAGGMPADDGTDEAPLEIPVCYAPAFAPDLGALAAHAGLAPEEVVARHAAGDYRVAMLGFAPGFPYLLGLDPALAMPRMDTPRL